MEGSMGIGSTVVLFDQGVVAGVVERDIKADVPESPMPTSVDDRDDILGLIFYITTPKYSITSLATLVLRRLCDFETSLAL